MADGNEGASRRAQLLRGLVSVVVVLGIFVGVLPRIADMGEVWTHVREMTGLELGTLVIATLWNQITYWLVTVAALPGLGFGQAAVVNLSSTAIANTVPAGGGIAIGVTVAMLRSWGHTAAAIGRYILVTGVWNNFVKLGFPVIALALLAMTGEANARLATAGVIGVVVLAVSLVLLALSLRSDELARRVGRWVGAVTNRLLRLLRRSPRDDWEERAASFREDSVELLRARWHWLTAATLVGHVSLYLVLLVTLRHVGVGSDQLTWIDVLAAFAFARLITAIPVTPGGLGMIELGYVGVLVALGGERAPVVAAVLVFRALTYLLPVPLGAITYVVWRRKEDWREDDAEGSEVAATSPAG